MRVTRSRHTPGLENGEDVSFSIGEKVSYRMRSGQELEIIIDSEYMQHSDSGFMGYESIFTDDNGRYFAVSKGIYNWKDKS